MINKSQWKQNKQEAKSQKQFNAALLLLTSGAWIFILKQFADQLFK